MGLRRPALASHALSLKYGSRKTEQYAIAKQRIGNLKR
jgi:hypothetical protein